MFVFKSVKRELVVMPVLSLIVGSHVNHFCCLYMVHTLYFFCFCFNEICIEDGVFKFQQHHRQKAKNITASIFVVLSTLLISVSIFVVSRMMGHV